MTSKSKKGKIGKRKEMIITLKSKPKSLNPDSSNPSLSKSNHKPHSFGKKGTKGPSWIG